MVYALENEPIREIKCKQEECFHLLDASAAMISFKDGEMARKIMKNEDLFVELQMTVQDNFFFAIDNQGKLAEVGNFLYPSLHFLAYEAQWWACMLFFQKYFSFLCVHCRNVAASFAFDVVSERVAEML